MRVSHALAAASALALLSCGSTRAAITVRVETNLAQPPDGDLNSVRVRVYSGAGPARVLRHDSVRVVGDGGVRLPFRFAVLPRDEAEGGVVTVEAVGCSDAVCGDPRAGYDPVLVEQRAIVGFIPGQVWELPMFLSVSCRGVRCMDPQFEQTCRPETGTCGPAQVTPGAADGGRDAQGDGATDADDASADASPDAAADVSGDAPADAATDARADAAADATADARADVSGDAPVDAANDARADAAADARLDAAVDVAAPMDARVDVAMDAGLDADGPPPMDARVDVAMDAGLDADVPSPPDAPPDVSSMDARDVEADAPATPDAPADLPPTEPVRSCGTGASAQTCRPTEDCCVLGSCGCLLVAVCTPRGVIGCR